MKRSARIFHRRLWLVLGIALPVLAVAMLMIRQSPQPDFEPQQIEQPGAN